MELIEKTNPGDLKPPDMNNPNNMITFCLELESSISETNKSESGYSTDSKVSRNINISENTCLQIVPELAVERSTRSKEGLLLPFVILCCILNPLFGIPAFVLYNMYLRRNSNIVRNREERGKYFRIITKITVLGIAISSVAFAFMACGFLLQKAFGTISTYNKSYMSNNDEMLSVILDYLFNSNTSNNATINNNYTVDPQILEILLKYSNVTVRTEYM